MTTSNPTTIVPLHEKTVSCRGDTHSAHPVTFLKMPATGSIQCPYCSHVFTYTPPTDETQNEANSKYTQYN